MSIFTVLQPEPYDAFQETLSTRRDGRFSIFSENIGTSLLLVSFLQLAVLFWCILAVLSPLL